MMRTSGISVFMIVIFSIYLKAKIQMIRIFTKIINPFLQKPMLFSSIYVNFAR